MSLDGYLIISAGTNFITLSLWLRERKLRISEKEKFAQYIKTVDKRFARLEKKNRLLQNS